MTEEKLEYTVEELQKTMQEIEEKNAELALEKYKVFVEETGYEVVAIPIPVELQPNVFATSFRMELRPVSNNQK